MIYVKSRILVIFFIDLVILFLSFLLMAYFKPGTNSYLSLNYFIGFGILLFIWILSSFYFKKYRFKRKYNLNRVFRSILLSNLAALSVVAIFIIAFNISGYSRLMFFGTVGIATTFEVFLANFYFLLIHTRNGTTDLYNPPPKAYEIKKSKQAINYRDISISSEVICEAITMECGERAFDFIKRFTNFDDPKVLFVSTATRFNIHFQPDNYFQQIVNLKKTNDIQYINKFFEAVNRKLPKDGTFIGLVETKTQRKNRILSKYPPIINWLVYAADFTVKRIFPKFLLTKKIYFLLTRGQNRVLTRAETLGRLYSCGFEIVDEIDIDNFFYFVVKKNAEPAYDMNPTYGPFIKLRRVGKGGKIIKVYKLRTMHPYAEYLQTYIYQKNKLEEGGKFKDDFRVSTLGKFFRTFWLDETPMIFNILKGDLKLVGVRPLSQHYFELYSEELKQKRIKYKPGLIPPFYVDLPKTLDEIQASELRYLEAYSKRPLITDWVYFWKAFKNIVFKKARSK
jgi:lipopolysaccharide/colanic/teichoic acid biosynthesis glycosyltransferase